MATKKASTSKKSVPAKKAASSTKPAAATKAVAKKGGASPAKPPKGAWGAKAGAAKRAATKAPAKGKPAKKTSPVAKKAPATRAVAKSGPSAKKPAPKKGAPKTPAPKKIAALKPAAKKTALAPKPSVAKTSPKAAPVKRQPAPRKAAPAVVRRDGAGHLDPKYAAGLLDHSGLRSQEPEPASFVDEPRAGDDLAENLGEEFVASATSGENQEEEILDKVVPEERGGPFVESTAGTEFAEGTDASNPEGADREPFPTT